MRRQLLTLESLTEAATLSERPIRMILGKQIVLFIKIFVWTFWFRLLAYSLHLTVVTLNAGTSLLRFDGPESFKLT